MGRIFNAWAALCGRPVYAGWPPARLLELGPDDHVLLECERALSSEQMSQLGQYVTAWLAGGDTRTAVLCGGIRLVAVRKSQAAGDQAAPHPQVYPLVRAKDAEIERLSADLEQALFEVGYQRGIAANAEAQTDARVAEERERCAKLCEANSERWDAIGGYGVVSLDCADLIRKS